jgi:hypothetical protein
MNQKETLTMKEVFEMFFCSSSLFERRIFPTTLNIPFCVEFDHCDKL